MRVNVYAEEITDRVEIISKEIDGTRFTGLRFYLYLPTTVKRSNIPGPESAEENPTIEQVRGPFIHREGDDDSAAVTFWGKKDLRAVLIKALKMLDEHYARKGPHPDEREIG